MKKKILYTFITLALLFLSVLIALPLLINSDRIQQEILQRINNSYTVKASVTEVKVYYLPLPHIGLTGVNVQHETFSLTSPSINIYPSWKILVGQAEVGRINLIEPHFTLNPLPVSKSDKENTEADTSPFILPDGVVSITDGTLLLPEFSNEFGVISKISFSDISAKVGFNNNHFNISWNSKPSFGDDLDFEAKISTDDYTSKGTLFLNGLDLSTVFSTSELLHLGLITDTSSFSVNFSYSPDKGFTLHFDGDVPDFTLTSPDLGDKPPVPFRVRQGDLDITFRENQFIVDIKKLELTEPQLKLTGICSYYLPEQGGEKKVKLDLRGEDIDVTIVREKLRALVGTNIVTQIVTEIVQNGYANSASYYFDAPISGFEDIKNMTIDVDIRRTNIHLKYVPVDLQDAKGKIRIKDGDLTGWDITTNVGNSHGRNGTFLVGLGHDHWGLTVDVDIDADLKELPKVLQDVISNTEVTDELDKLTMGGRADGHLHIGDDLRNFNIVVDVNSFDESEVHYGRLSWLVKPQKGSMQFTEEGARWQDLSLSIGPNIIDETSGSIYWTDNGLPFALNSISGVFDHQAILEELRLYPELKKRIDETGLQASGSSQIKGGLKGDFFKPEEYQYDLQVDARDWIIGLSYFPEEMVIDSAQIHLTDTSVNVDIANGMLLGDSLTVHGKISHDQWQNITGDMQIHGEVKKPIVSLLLKKKLLPKLLEFNTPALLSNMLVRWGKDDLLIQGGITPLDTDTTLNLKVTANGEITTGDLDIIHKGEPAKIRFFIENNNNKYDFFFTGLMPGQAVKDLLVDPFITFESIKGQMNVHTSFPDEETPPALIFTGDLTLDQLHFMVDHQRSIDNTVSFNVSGDNNILDIEEIKIRYGQDTLKSKGQFIHKGWSGYLNLDLTAPNIDTEVVTEIVDSLNTIIYERLGVKRRSAKEPSKYNLYSQFNFDFERFIVPFGEEKLDSPKGRAVKKYQFPVTPLRGKYNMTNTTSSLQVLDSNICGLEFEAFLTWFGETETSKSISVQTPKDQTIETRDFLECFNSNAVIEGTMIFKAKANSKKGSIKTAHFALSSEGGYIYKFAAVAKAISVLNIKGWSGSIWKKGYYYNQLEISGTIDNNILTISKMFIDGDGVDIVGKGTFNLEKMEYDMVFYVVPFASVTSFVTKVPIVGRLLGGKEGRIVSVPVKITGPAQNPDVSVMDAGEIGEATGKWIWDTVTIPFFWNSSTDSEEMDLEDGDVLTPIPQGQ